MVQTVQAVQTVFVIPEGFAGRGKGTRSKNSFFNDLNNLNGWNGLNKRSGRREDGLLFSQRDSDLL
jgi:hypothetical protein